MPLRAILIIVCLWNLNEAVCPGFPKVPTRPGQLEGTTIYDCPGCDKSCIFLEFNGSYDFVKENVMMMVKLKQLVHLYLHLIHLNMMIIISS